MLRFGIIVCVLCLTACSGDDEASDPSAAGSAGSGDQDGAGSSGNGGNGGSGAGSSAGSSGFDSNGDAAVDDGTDGGGAVGSLGDGSVPALTDPLELCGGPCACADGVDNDDDGVADGFDAECTGAGDDDEGTFATGIPGDNVDPKWQDCFFDGDSGGGNDGCRYASGCLTGELEDDDPDCEVSQKCIDFCQPRTPNGCDCFGCCTFTLPDGSERSVILEADCEEEDLASCTECMPAENGCGNECGRCELCPGKTLEDLPDDCGDTPTSGSGGNGGTGGSGGNGGSAGEDDPPPGYICDGGEDLCETTSDCGEGFYCSFGCCLVAVI